MPRGGGWYLEESSPHRNMFGSLFFYGCAFHVADLTLRKEQIEFMVGFVHLSAYLMVSLSRIAFSLTELQPYEGINETYGVGILS